MEHLQTKVLVVDLVAVTEQETVLAMVAVTALVAVVDLALAVAEVMEMV